MDRLTRFFLFSVLAGCTAPPPAPPASTTDAATPTPVEARARVVAVTGTAQRRPARGQPTPLRLGDLLGKEDFVVSGADGEVEIELGDNTRVRLAPATEAGVAELTRSLARVSLRDGRISAVVRGTPDHRLQVDVPASNTVASTSDGEFSVLARGDSVAVASKRGSVSVGAHGGTVTIGAGQLSIVQRGAVPTAPEDLPPSLFLKVAPLVPKSRAQSTTIRGTTSPGAVISVGSIHVNAGPDGQFSAVVAQRAGANRFVVSSEDVIGRRKEALLTSAGVDGSKPTAQSKVKW